MVSYRLRVRVAVPKYEPRAGRRAVVAAPAADAVKGRRTVYFDGGTSVEATLYERDRLDIGTTHRGPGDRRAVRRHDRDPAAAGPARVDGYRNLILAERARMARAMDAITIQILRNKIASLVDEMHYHFYRSGYSTIIRESRDFSCVILDRDGRLIVAPPMFFHAPVYRHLVGRILEVYGARPDAINDGDVFVSNHPYEGGLPHVSDMAFVAPVFADGEHRRLLRLDRAQGRCRRRGAGLDLGQRDRDVPRGPAAAADQDLGRRPARSPTSSASSSPTAASPS